MRKVTPVEVGDIALLVDVHDKDAQVLCADHGWAIHQIDSAPLAKDRIKANPTCI